MLVQRGISKWTKFNAKNVVSIKKLESAKFKTVIIMAKQNRFDSVVNFAHCQSFQLISSFVDPYQITNICDNSKYNEMPV